MKENDTYYFNQLKKAVATVFLKAHTAPKSIKDWKGDHIVLFQEDLFDKVKAKVSEKWFYTYFKNEAEKLPRIDMLNLLTQYVGFENWQAFKNSRSYTSKINTSKKMYLFGSIPLIVILLIIFFNVVSQ